MRGHIVKRGKDSYSVVIYLGVNPATGKRQYKWHTVTGNEQKAESELTRLLRELDTGSYVDPSALTVAEYLERWLTVYAEANVSQKTYERYRGIVTNHLSPAFGAMKLAKLHPLHIQSYYAKMRKEGRKDGRRGGLSAQTILHLHRVLSEALKMAVRWQLLARNPADAVQPPAVQQKEVKALDAAQTAWLLELAEGTRLYLPIMLAVTAGLRRGEILGLKWADVDWTQATIRIQRAVEETKTGVTMKAPKSRQSRRMVALPSITVEALRVHRAKQDEYREKLGPDYAEQDLICSVEDGSLWKPAAFTSAYRALIARRKLTGPNFHALRHSHASQMIAGGVDMKTVSSRLGHSRTAFTLDTYTHLLPGQDQEAARRLDVSLRSAREQIRVNRA